MRAVAAADRLVLGCFLLAAGALKVGRPLPFAHALFRLLPARLQRAYLAKVAAPATGLVEVAAGAGLVSGAWSGSPYARLAGTVAVVLFSGFVLTVVAAVRKGVSCGCWSSFSDGVAGPAEIGRSVVLAGWAWTAWAAEQAHPSGGRWSWWAPAWIPVVVATVWVVVAVGSRRRRYPGGHPAGMVGLVIGRVYSKAGTLDIASSVVLRRSSRSAAIEMVRQSPTGLAFAEWLGERSRSLDWATAVVRRTSSRGPEGRIRLIRVELPPAEGLWASLSYRPERSGAVDVSVAARVDGMSVVASRGQVECAGAHRT